jgi:hypothetical protein
MPIGGVSIVPMTCKPLGLISGLINGMLKYEGAQQKCPSGG